MEVKGKVVYIGEHIAINDSFRKREIAVKTDEQYPQTILVEFQQDKADLLNLYNIGQNVVIGINLRGREWVNPQGETKYFNTITGWKINAENASQQAPTQQTAQQQAPQTTEEDEQPF